MKQLIIILCVSLMIAPAIKAQEVDDAKQLIESERYGSAETLLEKSIGTAEPEPEINYLLVKSYLHQDKDEEAGRYVNQHLKAALSSDTDPLNRIACARYLLNIGNKGAAEEIFSSVYSDKKNQKNPSLLLAMAEVVIDEKEGNPNEALTWLRLAEKRDRKNPDIDIERGLAYRKLGDASNAYQSYQTAIKKDPQNVRAYYLLGKIFINQKNPDAYLPQLLKAYEIDSTYAPVLKELYDHYYYRDVATAKKYLEKYVANTDYSLQNDYYMTDMLYLTGAYQDAIQSANVIINKEQANAQPRLYKLIAYSYAKSGDSAKALQNINNYLAKENPEKVIAADYQFIAGLMEKRPGQEEGAIGYYSMAFDIDTVSTHKTDYAEAIAELYKKNGNAAGQAEWLGKLYIWKEKKSNIDLFNWGLAWYKANNYQMSDSVFAIYTDRYPEDIYGYYWRAQANASIDTTMKDSLAVPFYRKVATIGEQDTAKNKNMLLKAYGYLGGFEANITRDYPESLQWFEKYLALEENAEVSKYVEMLNQWISQKN